jgi:HK97 family phage prohead protease
MQHRTSVSEGAGLDFVISDGSRDRHGTRINPAGWDLTNFKRNPIALFGHSSGFPIGRWENVRVEGEKLLGRLVLASKGTSARIDELASLVEQGILRAVSVGFSVLEYGTPGKSPYDYMKQELAEVSLVSVPSNTNALAMARGLNISPETLSLAFGEHADMGAGHVTAGGHAEHRTATESRARGADPAQRKGKTMNISQRIENAQVALNAARDAYQNHVSEDDYDIEQARELKEAMDGRQERLNSLKEVERSLGC